SVQADAAGRHGQRLCGLPADRGTARPGRLRDLAGKVELPRNQRSNETARDGAAVAATARAIIDDLPSPRASQKTIMDPTLFDQLAHALEHESPQTAIERLCATLRERKDYAALFYALLLKKRHELGVSPVPSGPSQDLPAKLHEPYEDAIREAGRLVGRLYLDAGDIPRAWAYFRMLGEPAPVADALEKVRP